MRLSAREIGRRTPGQHHSASYKLRRLAWPLVRHGQGFFAEDLLARFGRTDDPLGMQIVAERDVDSIDLGIVDHRFVTAVCVGDPGRFGKSPGLFEATAADRPDHAIGCSCTAG